MDRVAKHADDQIFIVVPDQVRLDIGLERNVRRVEQNPAVGAHQIDQITDALRPDIERITGLTHLFVQAQQLNQIVV